MTSLVFPITNAAVAIASILMQAIIVGPFFLIGLDASSAAGHGWPLLSMSVAGMLVSVPALLWFRNRHDDIHDSLLVMVVCLLATVNYTLHGGMKALDITVTLDAGIKTLYVPSIPEMLPNHFGDVSCDEWTITCISKDENS